MITKQDIKFNVASQTLSFDAPEGRPSSVTDVQVWQDTDGEEAQEESATTGSGSVESVNTTFDVASGVSQDDPTLFYLAATTNIAVDRIYWATNAYSQIEPVEVIKIVSADSVRIRNTPSYDYANGDAFQSRRISITLATDWVGDTDNLSDPLCPRPQYRVAWTYVVGGATYYATTWFDLVRKPFLTTVTPVDVDRLARGWLARLSTDDQAGNGQRVIDEAVHQVKLDLWERGITAYALRHSDVLNELVRLRAVWLVSEQAFREGGVAQLAMELDRKNYWDRVANLVSSSQAQIQVTADGAGSTAPRAPLSRR
jgi:hypothetical protein